MRLGICVDTDLPYIIQADLFTNIYVVLLFFNSLGLTVIASMKMNNNKK